MRRSDSSRRSTWVRRGGGLRSAIMPGTISLTCQLASKIGTEEAVMLGRMGRRAFVRGASTATLAGGLVGAARAQAWPARPVRFICGYAAGGLTDIMARVTAE